jgi:NADH:ubiquinone oxidoreductase subunit E
MFAYDYGLAGVTPHDGEEVDSKAIFKILDKHAEARGALIAVLEDIQAQYGYLPQTALQAVSERLGCSLVDVYGVATFYGSFSLTPRGKHIICVCRGTACHVRGAPVVAEAFERELGIKAGQTTSDRKCTWASRRDRRALLLQSETAASAAADPGRLGRIPRESARQRRTPLSHSCPLLELRAHTDGYARCY